MDDRLIRLEEDLRRVPGVRSARVVGEDAPTEIHIVSGQERAPKQVVRDVQSLAQAGFGLAIDHRIVSVVQLDSEQNREIRLDDTPEASSPPPPPPPPVSHRPMLERVVFASKGNSGWVKVALKWPDGSETEGAGAATGSREARARGATVATLNALEPVLTSLDSSLEVDHVVVHRLGQSDAVLVRGVFYDGSASTPVVGSAVIHDDVATAAVRALLHAINRKLY